MKKLKPVNFRMANEIFKLTRFKIQAREGFLLVFW